MSLTASLTLTDRIGRTPLVALPWGSVERTPGSPARYAPEAAAKIRLFGKMEGNNPGSSVKDRAAWSMIRRAEERGDLRPGMRIIEPTSGNTGIALAMIAAARGYAIELVMPASATRERVLTMRAFGAKVVLTPAEQSMEGAIDFARARAAGGDYFMPDQFANDDNWRAHYETTGPEIWADTEGQVTHFVSAMGTTGTIMGVSRYLKEQNPAVQIVGLRPTEGSSIPGIRRWPVEYLPRIFAAERVDETVDMDQADAEESARRLATETGLFVGVSAAGAVLAAQRLCRRLADEGAEATVVTILCDRGDRYLSSPLFEGSGELEIIE